MLSPYRSIGVFSSSQPHQIKYDSRNISKVPFLVIPIGNTFLTYYADKLRLQSISDPTANGQEIIGLATDKHFIYAATYKNGSVLPKKPEFFQKNSKNFPEFYLKFSEFI